DGECDARTLVGPLQEHGPSRLRAILGELEEAKVRLRFPELQAVTLPDPRADVQAHVKALTSVQRRSPAGRAVAGARPDPAGRVRRRAPGRGRRGLTPPRDDERVRDR